jgi:hypothetical protein
MSKCCQYATNDYKLCSNLTTVSRKHNMFCEKLSHGLKRVERANMNGTKHVYIVTCPQETSRLESKLCLHPKSFCFKRL